MPREWLPHVCGRVLTKCCCISLMIGRSAFMCCIEIYCEHTVGNVTGDVHVGTATRSCAHNFLSHMITVMQKLLKAQDYTRQCCLLFYPVCSRLLCWIVSVHNLLCDLKFSQCSFNFVCWPALHSELQIFWKQSIKKMLSVVRKAEPVLSGFCLFTISYISYLEAYKIANSHNQTTSSSSFSITHTAMSLCILTPLLRHITH